MCAGRALSSRCPAGFLLGRAGPASFTAQTIGATAACSLQSHLPSWRPVLREGVTGSKPCASADPALCFKCRDGHIRPRARSAEAGRGGARGELTLRQAYSWPRPRVQYAFKDSMIHGILQFTLRIAFRCVLHRCGSQDIRC